MVPLHTATLHLFALNADNSFTAPDTTTILRWSIPNPSPPPEEVISQVGFLHRDLRHFNFRPCYLPEEATCRYVVTSAGYGASEIGFPDDNTFTQLRKLFLLTGF